jgi:hypothetical protein
VTLRRQITLVALALAGMAALAALLIRVGSAPGSTLSREAHGWIVARRYAEERGIEVRLLDRFEAPGPDEALITVFPWQTPGSDDARWLAGGHVLRGGTLVVAYTGSAESAALPEESLFTDLGLSSAPTDLGRAPRHPLRWREAQEAEWPLLPAEGPQLEEAARVRRMPRLPDARDARVLFETPDGRALVSIRARGSGRIVLLPAEALANARLSAPGNARLLETLIQLLPQRWVFDEYHHGLTAGPADAPGGHSERAFTLFFFHLAVVYLMAVLALARRFGPPWREPLTTTGNVRSFFLGVGALHARLGHQREAASLLRARARELDPAVSLDLPPPSDVVGDAAFLRYAQDVARAQQRRP